MKILHNHRQRRITIFLTIFMMFCPSVGFSGEKHKSAGLASSAAKTRTSRTITYYEDKTITVPDKITRVASGWPAQNSVIAMLGYGDKIVATMDMIKSSPTFRKFVPSISNAVTCFNTSGEINLEAIIQARPDVVFSPDAGTNANQFKRLEGTKIPVAYLKSNSLRNLVERTMITGQILGDDAYGRARNYVKYYNSNVQRVTRIISKISQTQRVKVYHSMGNPLATQGAPSLVQDWMDLAGAVNIAKNWNLIKIQASGQSNTNMEQIIAADPAVIVCMYAADVQAIKTDPRWSAIRAVKDGKVYVNPRGLFLWCRETTEEALQFLWLAKTLYPALFRDIDMVKETKYFYKTFYGYDLSDSDVHLFLNPT